MDTRNNEPQNDSAQDLKNYGEHFFKFDNNTVMLRMDEKPQKELMKKLDVPVSFNDEKVNLHGVCLYVLDKQGGVARKYHTLMWDDHEVVNDLKRLLQEE